MIEKPQIATKIMQFVRRKQYKHMEKTAAFWLNYMEQRSTETWTVLRATAMDTTDAANSSSTRRSRRPKI